MKVDRPMMVMVMRKARLRPDLSPMRPKISAPSGRIAKPAAKVSRVKMKPAVSFTLAKKWRDISGANVPKRMKS